MVCGESFILWLVYGEVLCDGWYVVRVLCDGWYVVRVVCQGCNVLRVLCDGGM